MANLRLCVLVLAIIVLSGGNACLAEKITVDPYAGPAQPKAETTTADPRLAQRITYEAWHTPVKTILADLSQKTGVTLHSGYSKNDWQVRDRKMNILVSDVTLAQLMNSIARVMKFKWSINDEKDPPTYRLYADRRLLVKLQAEASRRHREFKREEMTRRTRLVEALAEVGDASGAQLEALEVSNPYLYLCAETGFAKLMTQMFSEEPRFSEIFIGAEKNLMPEMTVLSPATQQLCASVMRKIWPLDHIRCNRRQLPDDLEEIIQNYSVHMEIISRPFEEDLRQRLFDFGNICTVASTGDHIIGWLKDPNAESSQAWARSFLTALDQEIDTGGYYNQLAHDVANAQEENAKDIEYYYLFDPVAEHADEPDVDKKVKTELTDEIEKESEEQLKALGKHLSYQAVCRIKYQANLRLVSCAADLDVVSDSFSVVASRPVFADGEQELGDVLDDLAEGYRCNWEKRGSVLEIRRRDWFRRRSSQIPDEWIEPWREEIENTGTVSLDTHCQMATLSDDQIEENINSDQILKQAIGIWWSYGNNKGFARFYQQLTAYQCSLIYTEEGLDPNMLSFAQWPYYVEMFHYGRRHTWDTEQFTDCVSNRVAIKGSRTTLKNGDLRYSFEVVLTRDNGSIRKSCWAFPLPRITWLQDQRGASTLADTSPRAVNS